MEIIYSIYRSNFGAISGIMLLYAVVHKTDTFNQKYITHKNEVYCQSDKVA